MANCSGNCGSCKSDCSERKDMRIPCNPDSRVKKVIGIVSGKGGVGKSLVTSLLSVQMRQRGHEVGILDADITGPSIPKAFGVHGRVQANDKGMLPPLSESGIKLMSINLLLQTEDTPVVWRAPVITGVIQQFWQEVVWGNVDYMFVDLPPGTGDVPLTVFQNLPLDGIVIVSTPQDLVTMIVKKAYNMAQMMNIPILGLVENMSYLRCPDCQKEISVFGESKADAIADALDIPVLAKLPIESHIAALVDSGTVEYVDLPEIAQAAEKIEKALAKAK